MTTPAPRTVHAATAAFLAETLAPSVLGHDDAMLAIQPIARTLNAMAAQAGKYRELLDDASLLEPAAEVRAHFEALYQTIGAVTRLTAEVSERTRHLALAERQLDELRAGMLATLERLGYAVPEAPRTP